MSDTAAASERSIGNPWKARLVWASLLTDPVYVAWRLKRRLTRRHTLVDTNNPTPGAEKGRRTIEPHAPEKPLPSFDVDLVYCWVHGQDPEHQKLRNFWARRYGLNPVVSNPDVRYVEHDELRYSLRSVERFLPWVRTIFIVTPRQTPEWLDLTHPKIRMVDQDTIMADPAWPPVFNSLAIEAQLSRIPGLSEHFIYCNDDMFFGQPCEKLHFFALNERGKSRVSMKVMLSERADDWIIPWTSMGDDVHARLWMAQWNNVKVSLELRCPWRKVRKLTNHQAQPMTRTALENAARRFPGAWERTCASKFRGPDDFEFLAMARYLSLADGTGTRGYMPNKVFRNEAQLARFNQSSLPQLFCVNDGAGEDCVTGERHLARLFPEHSSFERA